MKSTILLIALLLCFGVWGFGQVTGDLEKDVKKAGELFEKVNFVDDEDNPMLSLSQAEATKQALETMKEVIAIYENYELYDKIIAAKGYVLYISFLEVEEWASYKFRTPAEELIQLAKEKLQDEKHPCLKFSYLTLVLSYKGVDNEKTLSYINKLLPLVKKPSDLYFNLLNIIDEFYVKEYQYLVASQLLNEMEAFLKADTEGRYKEYIPLLYYKKLLFNDDIGNYQKAVIYGEKCMAIHEKEGSYQEYDIPGIYAMTGLAYAALKQYDKGLELINKGINLLEDEDVRESYSGALGNFYDIKKDYQKAIEYYQKELNLYLGDEEFFREGILSTQLKIANCYYQLKDYDKALTYIPTEETVVKKHKFKLFHANIIGQKGNHDEALKQIQELLVDRVSGFESKNITNNPITDRIAYSWSIGNVLSSKAEQLNLKAQREKSSRHFRLAIETYEIALTIYTRLLDQMQGYESSKMNNNEEIRSVLLGQIKSYYQLYQLEQNKEDLKRCFTKIEQRKAMVLLEGLTEDLLPEALEEGERTLVKQLRRYELKLATCEADSLKFYQNKMITVSEQLDLFLEKANKDYTKQVSNFYKINYADLEGFQGQLATNTLYVNYTLSDSDLQIFLISNDNADTRIVEIDEQFTNDITTFYELIKDPFLAQRINREKFINISHRLYQTLIAPIEEELAEKSKLMITSEQDLFYLPFELLLASDEKKSFEELDYLIKKYEINYQYSATIHQQTQRKSPVADYSFLAFAPVFKRGTPKFEPTRSTDFLNQIPYRSVKNNRFIPLPNTKKEVEAIAQLLKDKGTTTLLLEEKATKANYIKQVRTQPYQFVHIATHGIVNYQNHKLSALACYQTDKTTDNLLFANEIQFQNINADLVILSSCESGIGQLVSGEGMLALNRSFIYAGARNVLFSLWKVSDQESSTLMIDFYTEYLKNPSYTAALRQAKLNMISNPKTALPTYWAPFVLIGE